MLKIGIFTIAFILLCLGAWELLLYFEYPGNKSTDWKTVDGWLTERGGLHPFHLPGKKAQALNFLIEDQHTTFVYFADGIMHYKRQELPPNLAPVRMFLTPPPPKEHKSSTTHDISIKPTFDTAFDTGDLSLDLPLARLNEKTNRLEILTQVGTVIKSNYATNYMGQKWEELPVEQWDHFMPKVKIKYDPKDPKNAVTDPDILNGAPIILGTAITLIASSVLLFAGALFHAWVTKPSEDIDPYPIKTRRY